ncbi:MAG: alpha/beta hydrolase, partial [Minicystis sp.]
MRVESQRSPAPGRPPTPVVFGPAAGQLFGLYHAPDAASARATGVVLCNPLGYEAMCVHRMYRQLAEKLAAAGIHALRFDYHGTGDSSGQVDEPARVRAWLDSIGAA